MIGANDPKGLRHALETLASMGLENDLSERRDVRERSEKAVAKAWTKIAEDAYVVEVRN